MEFRILGPLSVRADGGEIGIGGPRSQRVLAVLLLHANRVVTAPRLVAAAWDQDPPATARRQVINRVAALRNGLYRYGGCIETHGSGYRLRIAPDELDLLVFEKLIGDARATADHEQSALILREALSMWTGPALAGLSGELIEREAAALNEARIAVLGDCVDHELAIGGEVSLVPELTQLVAEHPTGERFVGQLMTALSRTGRSGEALEAFRGLRTRLAEELGIEPGEQLCRLQLAVLNGEVAAAAVPGNGVDRPRAAPVPRQLPVDVASFTGRRTELAEVDLIMGGGAEPSMVALVIEGVGGIGKSALAIHAAHRLADRFPDGQLYVDLQGFTPGLDPLTPQEVLGRFMRAMNVKHNEVITDIAELATQFRSATATRRLLIVLDNARDAAQIVPLLPNSSGCGVIVTSRRLLTALDGAAHLKLEVLSETDAMAQLTRIAGRRRVNADPETAAEVVHWCGHLPLALRIAAARLAARPTWSMPALADRLRDTRSRLDELELPDVGVRASFEMSREELCTSGDALDLAAASALMSLSLLDGGDISTRAAGALLAEGLSDTERVLERLVDANLLETPAYGRYRLHDLVRLYARETATASMSQEDQAAALSRVFRMYAVATWHTFELIRPGDQRIERARTRSDRHAPTFGNAGEALGWLEEERPNLVAAVVQGADRRFAPNLPIELAQALYAFFRIRGYWTQVLLVNEAVLPVSQRAGDRLAEATASNDIGVALAQYSQWDRATGHLRRALDLYRTEHHDYGEGQTLNNLGVIHQLTGDSAVARDLFEQALAVHVRSGNQRGEAMSLGNLGTAHRDLENYEQARDCHRRALVIFERLNDRFGQAVGLLDLGTLHARIGSFDEAVRCLRGSLGVCRDMGDRFGEAEALKGIGAVLREQTRHTEALDLQRKSLAIYRELGRREGEINNLREIGRTLAALGRQVQADASVREAEELSERLHGSPPLELVPKRPEP